ncbi:MAG: hypothetical protein JOZ22_22945 [Acidobacteriia bacterium]|nr:hypothetical protein [Terriglobia bacterium]
MNIDLLIPATSDHDFEKSPITVPQLADEFGPGTGESQIQEYQGKNDDDGVIPARDEGDRGCAAEIRLRLHRQARDTCRGSR